MYFLDIRQLPVHGSVFLCPVHRGRAMRSWRKSSCSGGACQGSLDVEDRPVSDIALAGEDAKLARAPDVDTRRLIGVVLFLLVQLPVFQRPPSITGAVPLTAVRFEQQVDGAAAVLLTERTVSVSTGTSTLPTGIG